MDKTKYQEKYLGRLSTKLNRDPKNNLKQKFKKC